HPGFIRGASQRLVGHPQPVIDLALSLILRVAIALLQTPGQLVALAFDHVEVVVGKLTPLLLHLAFEFVPIACNAIQISSLSSYRGVRDADVEEPIMLAKSSSTRTAVRERKSHTPTDRRPDIAKAVGAQSTAVDCAPNDQSSTGGESDRSPPP